MSSFALWIGYALLGFIGFCLLVVALALVEHAAWWVRWRFAEYRAVRRVRSRVDAYTLERSGR